MSEEEFNLRITRGVLALIAEARKQARMAPGRVKP